MVLIDLKDRYPLVFKAACENILRENKHKDLESCYTLSIRSLFDWSKTSERHEFWYSVYFGDMRRAESLIPSLFITIKEGVQEKVNGLWV